MTDQQSQRTFRRTLKQLRQSPEALPWNERRQVAQALGAALAGGDESDVVRDLVATLADDPKWEVRGDIAGLLHALPERAFERTVAKLSEDSNGFVRRAAQRALDRRRRVEENVQRSRQGREHLRARLATLERLYGKAAADKARQVAEQMFDELIGALVHEMRGVLTPLKGVAFFILHPRDADPAAIRRQLVKLSGRLAFLERLLDDMREYSQSPTFERRSERLADLVTESETMVRESLKAGVKQTHVKQTHVKQTHVKQTQKVAIEVAVPPEITAEVSRDQIVMAIGNVVKNAVESYSVDGKKWRAGKVRIGARVVDGEWVNVVVADDGQGILAEDLDDIRQFQPGKTTKKGWGTGFGLPLAHRYVAAHGGRIGIESKENQGTTVTIALPLESQTGENGHAPRGAGDR